MELHSLVLTEERSQPLTGVTYEGLSLWCVIIAEYSIIGLVVVDSFSYLQRTVNSFRR